MLDFLKEIALILLRIITILPLLLFITIFMGKRVIGELPIFDFLVVIILGAVVGADIADPNIEHFPTVIAIIAIALLQKGVAKWKLSNRKIGRLLTFEPTIVVQDGKFVTTNLEKIHYSIDNILQMLREKEVFDIKDVETAIVEANGSLSVWKKPSKNTVTREDMNIIQTASSISYPIIVEGTMYEEVLEKFNVDDFWLKQQLSYQGVVELDSVFYASINKNHEVHISLKDDRNILIPPIKH